MESSLFFGVVHGTKGSYYFLFCTMPKLPDFPADSFDKAPNFIERGLRALSRLGGKRLEQVVENKTEPLSLNVTREDIEAMDRLQKMNTMSKQSSGKGPTLMMDEIAGNEQQVTITPDDVARARAVHKEKRENAAFGASIGESRFLRRASEDNRQHQSA